MEIDKDNSKLLDAGVANQGLTTADIARLKAEGKSGDEIVAALAANSATFQNKTHYSQVGLSHAVCSCLCCCCHFSPEDSRPPSFTPYSVGEGHPASTFQ